MVIVVVVVDVDVVVTVVVVGSKTNVLLYTLFFTYPIQIIRATF